jgi:hypothetical protein
MEAELPPSLPWLPSVSVFTGKVCRPPTLSNIPIFKERGARPWLSAFT